MNETCMKHALNMPDIDGCPYCKNVELELARDNYKNVLVGMEFENIDSLAMESGDTTQIGRVAAQRIHDLEQQLKSAIAYHGVLVKDKNSLRAELRELKENI